MNLFIVYGSFKVNILIYNHSAHIKEDTERIRTFKKNEEYPQIQLYFSGSHYRQIIQLKGDDKPVVMERGENSCFLCCCGRTKPFKDTNLLNLDDFKCITKEGIVTNHMWLRNQVVNQIDTKWGKYYSSFGELAKHINEYGGTTARRGRPKSIVKFKIRFRSNST